MLESNDTLLDKLPLALIRQIDAIARRAERLWRSGDAIEVDTLLQEVPPIAQPALLEELLVIEAEQQLEQGQKLSKDNLLARFPHHATIIERVLSELSHRPKRSSEQDALQHRFPSIPGYTFQRQLGRGSMGVVYLARQERLQRLVAVKVVVAGFDLPQAAAIVRAEAAVIARLKHPNIVQVYEIGEDDGEPFLTIEYVDGESLRERLLKERLPQRQAVELIEQLARAIHHAHTNGVVHRDLKPANILLVNSAGELIPKISDFGLAKVLDTLQEQTGIGMVLGTPKYMAPEQAEGRSAEIGPATDVYALGAILFELLAGRAPFESASSLKLMQAISHHEVRFPLAAYQSVSADLQAICLKCLEKLPARRYASALELADDIRRFLDDFPVLARRPARLELVTKFIRRNPSFSTSIAVVFASLIAASIIIVTFAIRESQARARAELLAKKESEALASVEALREMERRNVYWANLHLAQKAWQGNRLDHMRQHLNQIAPTSSNKEDLRGFEWYYLWRLSSPTSLTLNGHYGASKVAFNPSGQLLATPSSSGDVRFFNSQTGELEFALPASQRVMDIAFSPDGSKAAVADREFKISLWDLNSRKILRVLQGHGHSIRSIAFSPDNQQLISADEVERVVAWNANSGQQVWSIQRPDLYVSDIEFDRYGERLVIGCGLGNVVIVNAKDGLELLTIKAHSRWVTGVAFSPDGEHVASCSEDRKAKLWSLADSEMAIEIVGHEDVVTAVAFSHDGQTIGTASNDGTVRLWDAKTGQHRTSLVGHSNWVRSVTFSADDSLVASSSTDGTVRIWKPDLEWEIRTLTLKDNPVTSIAFSPEGDALFIGGHDGEIAVKDVKSGDSCRKIGAHGLPIRHISLNEDGSKVATSSDDHTIKIWDTQNGEELVVLEGHTTTVNSALFLAQDKQIASASYDGTIRIWDAATGKQLHMMQLGTPQLAIACSPDGRLLASTGTPNVEIWDTSNWTKIAVLEGQNYALAALAFSADGELLAAGSTDRTIRIWDLKTGKELNRINGHTNVVTCVRFSQGNRRIVSGSQDGTVRIWETSSGRELLTLKNNSDWVNCVSFDPSERIIASASSDGTVKLIELD